MLHMFRSIRDPCPFANSNDRFANLCQFTNGRTIYHLVRFLVRLMHTAEKLCNLLVHIYANQGLSKIFKQ